MRQRTYSIPQLSKVDVEKGVWFHRQRSPGQHPDRDLATSLNWLLEQMLFGQFGMYADTEDGAVVGLNVGIDQPAAGNEKDQVHEAEQRLQTKHVMMQLAGLVANSRIEGVEPRHEEVPTTILRVFQDDAESYTRYYFAFELVAALKRIDERIHSLSVQPIKVGGFEDCRVYLAEATRCWLFGLDAASAALSRAALERALREAIRRVPSIEPPPGKQGLDLIDLVRVAHELRILDNHSRHMAHQVRLTGNAILHGERTAGLGSGDLLIQARAVIEHVVRATVTGEQR
ncbi:MAG: hypothetical protein ABSE56_14665 [Bryobacteraceae bacterium]